MKSSLDKMRRLHSSFGITLACQLGCAQFCHTCLLIWTYSWLSVFQFSFLLIWTYPRLPVLQFLYHLHSSGLTIDCQSKQSSIHLTDSITLIFYLGKSCLNLLQKHLLDFHSHFFFLCHFACCPRLYFQLFIFFHSFIVLSSPDLVGFSSFFHFQSSLFHLSSF